LQLEDRVAERTSELQRTNEFLAESIQRVQRSEAALADRKADLRAVLTNAHDAYICIDANGLVVDWNKQAEKIFGWNAEEVIGRRLDELIVPLARREGHRRGLESLSASGVARMLDRRLEMPALRRDGTVFPCEMTVTALASRTRGQLFAVFLQDISSRKEAQRSLSAAHERLEDLYQHAPCGYYSLDAAGSFCEINEGALQLFESDREALIGKRSPRDFMTEIGRARFSEVYHEFMLTGHFGPEEFDFIGAGGRMRRVSIRATALRDTQGRYLRSRTVAIDVTELHRTRLALQASNRQQHLMLDNELFGIVKLQNRVTVWANRAFARMFGYSPEEVHQLPMRSLYEDDETFERMGAEAYAAIANGEAYRTQMWLTGKSGTRLWVDIHGALLDPASGEAIWMLSDITSMKLYQEKVERLAFHDTLTGLPNRRLLDDRVKQALSMAQRRGEKVAVCFLDLDGFKPVNDRFGHECGDEVLKQTASRLLGAVREHDTVARLGGDEFVILLTNVAETDDPEAVMVRAVESLAMPYVIGGRHEVTISASFGLAVGPRDGASADELIQFADGAMYEYKRRARRYLADAQDVRCMQR
jgi:diguanylate cyclase (GGDEF)-like protein/PAS domain S-box-containing protein